MAHIFNLRRIHEGSLALLFLAGTLVTSSPAQTPSNVIPGQEPVATDGRSVQLVQYRQAMRPVYPAAPAQVALTYVYPSVAPGFSAPMMAVPMFTQPIVRYFNAWQPQQQPAATYVQQQPAPAAAPAAQPAQAPQAAVSYGDPYGFTSWLNSVRAQYGLAPVAYDANLTNWAASNNNAQLARGMGHHVMGPARRQNAAIGSSASIGGQWMNSPAHRAALLDPSIRAIGIAGAGQYWTFNAY